MKLTLEKITISHGSHPNRGDELCVMEAVAYVAGEPHGDHPACACPVITKFLINWNDDLPTDADRERLLKPLVPLLVGTKSTPEVEKRRSDLAADWLIRECAPAWLELAGLKVHAEALRMNPTLENCQAAQRASAVAVAAARAAASAAGWAASRATARGAASAAGWSASRAVSDPAMDAASDAAWAAAKTAWTAMAAASDVAWAVAKTAAWTAAGPYAWVAGPALAPTVEKLQLSAVELVKRMIAVK